MRFRRNPMTFKRPLSISECRLQINSFACVESEITVITMYGTWGHPVHYNAIYAVTQKLSHSEDSG